VQKLLKDNGEKMTSLPNAQFAVIFAVNVGDFNGVTV